MTAHTHTWLHIQDAILTCQAHLPNISHRHTTTVQASEACGRVLAADVHALIDVPPFARAMMDGYAIVAESVAVGQSLPVIAELPAGQSFVGTLEAGQAIHIMTGAPMPSGATAVVRWEWCEVEGQQIRILTQVTPSDSVQPQGEDGLAGSVLLPQGHTIGHADLPLLRAFGVAQVRVYEQPRVAIVITGSELVQDITQPLQPGQIYGSNDAYLTAAVEVDGAHVGQVHYVPDDALQIRSCLEKCLAHHDVIIITGGVSTGDYDFVPAVMANVMGSLLMDRVWMRPGSPFVAASGHQTMVFGLSGNPAACFTQYETLVRPVLHSACGRTSESFSSSGRLLTPLSLKPIKHTRILRATASIRDAQVWVDTDRSQSPGILSSFASSNCLVWLDHATYAQGDQVPLHWLPSTPPPHRLPNQR